MSDIEEILTAGEELPMEDQKKAINLQDLIYVKKYIDDRQNNYESEMDTKHSEFKDELNDANATFKDELNTNNAAFKEEVRNTIQDTMSDEIQANIGDILNGNQVVGKAENANYATNSTNADNAIKKADGTYTAITQNSDGGLRVESEVIEKKILILDTGETADDTYTTGEANIIYNMPDEMTFDGKYCMELAGGEIIYFKPSNWGGVENLYVHRHVRAFAYDTSVTLYVTSYRFHFTNRTITIEWDFSKKVTFTGETSSVGDGTVLRINKIWKIIE